MSDDRRAQARPWWDIVEQVEAVTSVVPESFKMDLDFVSKHHVLTHVVGMSTLAVRLLSNRSSLWIADRSHACLSL